MVKNPPPSGGGHKRLGFDSWVSKIPWRRPWQFTPIFLPGESHGQWSLVGYSPQGCKESTLSCVKQLSTHILIYVLQRFTFHMTLIFKNSSILTHVVEL